MKKSEEYLNEVKKLWENEPQKSRRWQFWYLTPARRLAVLHELLCPFSASSNPP